MNNNLQLMDKPETVSPTVTYILIHNRLDTEDFSVENSFGIGAVDTTTGKTILSIQDISTNKGKVEALIGLLNRNAISIEFLSDILDDFLVDFEV